MAAPLISIRIIYRFYSLFGFQMEFNAHRIEIVISHTLRINRSQLRTLKKYNFKYRISQIRFGSNSNLESEF